MSKKRWISALVLLLCAFANGSPSRAQRSLAISLYATGQAAYKKGNYRDSLRIFKQCKEAADNTKISGAEMAALLQATGEAERALGLYQDAEKTFKQALAVADTLPPRLNLITPYVFNSMALLNKDLCHYPEAEGLWKQHERMYRGHTLYSINNLAYLYFTWGKLDQELEYVKKAMRIKT